MYRLSLALVLVTAAWGCHQPAGPKGDTRMPTNSSASAPNKQGTLAVNGLAYYYEIHGSGEPLLLLHGGLGSIDMFRPVLPALAERRQVVAVDLHGHGRTALGDREISLIDQGNDMAEIIKQL